MTKTPTVRHHCEEATRHKSRSRVANLVLGISVVLAALAVTLLLYRSATDLGADVIAAGDTMSEIPGLDLPKPQALLVFVSIDCGYCVQSGPFFRRLRPTASRDSNWSHTSIIAVTQDSPDEIEAYLADHRIVVDDVLTTDAAVPGVPFVPMLVLVDHAGIVLDLWIGLLDESQENQVLAVLANPEPMPASERQDAEVRRPDRTGVRT